ncbi:unnamed protein product, partial [Mesorhabditis spiculigera]
MGNEYYNNKFAYQNQKNNKMVYGGYQPVPGPTAPSLEININQNHGGASPVPSYASAGRRPPNHPPPIPPVSEYAQPAYNPMWFDRFPRRENRGMFRLALVEAMLALVVLGGGIWCARDTSDYCPWHSAIWTGAFFLINAIIGSAAAKIGSINLYMAHLVMSLVCVGMCLIGGGLSTRNWITVGTYGHPKIERGAAFCLLGEHDPSRISYIFSHMDKYDFRSCLFQLKVGIAVNSIQIVVSALQGKFCIKA